MKYYHGTSLANWEKIVKSGFLFPETLDLRIDVNKKTLHLADGPDIAKTYGSVVLEIEFEGKVLSANQDTSYAIFEAIPISKIKKLTSEEIKNWSPIVT